MPKLYVYEMSDNCTAKTWDDVDYGRDGCVVAIITGQNNDACEAAAFEAGYSDSDRFTWGYESFEALPRDDNPVMINA